VEAKGKEVEKAKLEAQTKIKEAETKAEQSKAELEKAKLEKANAKDLDSNNNSNSNSNSNSDILNKILIASLSDNKLMNDLVNSIKTQPNRDIPDKFGPNTTMAELANYFADVVLFQLMSKFDINTSMNLRDILLTMNKANNNMGNNMGLNSNGIGSGNMIGNVTANGFGNGVVNPNNNARTSKDLLEDLKINIEPGIDNTGTGTGQNQYGNTSDNTAGNMYPGMGMGMGMGMGSMGSMGMGSMGTGTGTGTGSMGNQPDTRSRLDIQNENADMDLQNTKLSAENESLNAEIASSTEQVTKYTTELNELKKNPNPNDEENERIKQLESTIAQEQVAIKEKGVQITKNQNIQADNERKLKANKYAEWKRKSNWEVASDVGSGAYDYGKRSLNAVGNAASDTLTGAQDLASRMRYGKDISVLNDEHKALTDKKTAEEANIKKLKEEMNGADGKRLREIQREIDKSNKNIGALDKQITNKETERTKQQGKIEAIKNKYTDDEMPTSVPSPVVSNASRIEAPESRNANQITSDHEHDENAQNEIRSGTHAHAQITEKHPEGHGTPSVRTRMSNAVEHGTNFIRKRFIRTGGTKKLGGKKLKTKKTIKLQKG